jgi:hypothetical protein
MGFNGSSLFSMTCVLDGGGRAVLVVGILNEREASTSAFDSASKIFYILSDSHRMTCDMAAETGRLFGILHA